MEDEFVVRRKRAEDALKDLDEIEASAPAFLPSTALKKAEQKKKEAAEISEPTGNTEWMDALATLRTEKGNRRNIKNIFGEGKKKKGKKKKKGEPRDYSEDFERELSLLEDLVRDQLNLAKSLQARYDILDKQKSAARGVGKFTTDLLAVLNNARALQKDAIDKIIGTKKTIAELNMKEREKFGNALFADGNGDAAQTAAQYLKELLNTDTSKLINSGYDVEYVDDADDVADDLLSGVDDIERRNDLADRYMKYENRNVTVMVRCDPDLENKEFFALDEDGDELDDYPLPSTIDSVNVNVGTMLATDKFGQKFQVVFN